MYMSVNLLIWSWASFDLVGTGFTLIWAANLSGKCEAFFSTPCSQGYDVFWYGICNNVQL